MNYPVSRTKTLVAPTSFRTALHIATALALLAASGTELLAQYHGSFTNIRPVQGLEGRHIASNEISDDGLALSMSLFSGGRYALYETTRESTLDPFDKPVSIDELNRAGTERLGQTISSDGLTTYFSSGPAGGTTSSIWMSERDSREEPWNIPQEADLDSDAIRTGWLTLSDDDLTMYYQANHGGKDQLFQVERPSIHEPFGDPVPISELNASNAHRFAPTVASDELAIMFSTTGSSVNTMIATRTSKAEPFGRPMNLDDFGLGSNLNSAFQYSASPVLSATWPADGSKLYFTGNPSDFQLYEATWNVYAPGDANLDDEVSFADFLILSENFGQEGAWRQGDFDGDGTVGFLTSSPSARTSARSLAQLLPQCQPFLNRMG